MKYSILVLLAFMGIVQSQQLPIDFETATTWESFGGGVVSTINNPQNNADNSSSMVGQMVKNAGEVYGGSYIDLATNMDFTTNNVFSMKVYAPHTNTKVLLKVEDINNPANYFQKERIVHNPGVWETVLFNFSEIDANLNYARLVIIFDNGTMGDGSANFTYLMDDIELYEYNSGLSQMDLPVTFDDTTVDYGLIGFEGITDNSIVDNPNASGLNVSPKVAKVVKGVDSGASGGTTISNLLEEGFATAIPFSAGNTTMYCLVHSPDAGIPVRLKVEDHTDPTVSVETQVNTTTSNEWEVLEFDFSNEATGTAAINFSSTYDKASIFFNFGTDGATAGEKIYYFDTLQMTDILSVEDISSNEDTVQFYPNPSKSGHQITFSQDIQLVEIFDMNGRLVQTGKENTMILSIPSNVYIMKIRTIQGEVSTKKLIVQ